MELVGIFAHSMDDVFGVDGHLPWRKIHEDMNMFRNTTLGHTVLMGSNTWKSLGCKALYGRVNVIVSKDYKSLHEEFAKTKPSSGDGNTAVYFFRTADEAIAYLSMAQIETVYVIGGAKLFESLQSKIDKWIVTTVDYVCGILENIPVTRYEPNWLTSRPGMTWLHMTFVPVNDNPDGIKFLRLDTYRYMEHKDYTRKRGFWDRIKYLFKGKFDD